MIKVSDQQTDAECRCSRCGRLAVVNETGLDYQRFMDDRQPSAPAATESPADSKPHENTALIPVVDDPEATVARTALQTGESWKYPAASAMPADDFIINAPRDNDLSFVQNQKSPAPSGLSKYDLSQRVMRPITKPVVPIIPYSGMGEYEIHRVLRVHQKGGMGRILVAYDQYLKREVAIKELHPDIAEDDNIVRRFIGEAEITAQLEHPGVVPIHRLGQGGDGLPYYTMKMIKGDTLQDAIKAYHRKPTKPELLNLIRRLVSVSKTIAFAHSNGVIHRDLKPANVMLGEHGETLVMDWGLAKPFSQTMEESYVSIVHRTKQPRPELTMAGAIVGTPAFMSPEQASAEDNVIGPLSDVFGLGTVLYYLLAGQTAFSGRSTQEVLDKVRACHPTPPSQIKSNVPHGLEKICLKAMEKLPANRYQGALEFADDLCRWLDNEPLSIEKKSLMNSMRQWMIHHRMLSVGVPCVLLLSVVLTCLSVWLIEQNLHDKNPNGYVPTISTEFQHPLRAEGSPALTVWLTKPRYEGDLLLTCRVEPTESKTHHVLTIHAPASMPWDLTGQNFLTFSLLEIPAKEDTAIQNFRLRLGQGTAYYEYKPGTTLWENRSRATWVPFRIPLKKIDGDWSLNTGGESAPLLTTIERIEIHFDADSEMTLNFDNFRFRAE